MKWLQKLLLCAFLFWASCTSSPEQKADEHSTFDRVKWDEAYDGEYLYREQMLQDLVDNHLLHGMKQDSVVLLLGQPDRTDNSHLFYRISQKKLGLFALQTKTLVIKFTKDSVLEWRKLHG